MKKLTTIILSVFAVTTVFAQDMSVLEAKLLKSFTKIHYWASEGREKVYSMDSLVAANQHFEEMLYQDASTNTASLTHPFQSLVDKGLHISTAPNGKFRIYTWNTLTGGRMDFYKNLVQFESDHQVFAEIDKDEDAYPGVVFNRVDVIQVVNKDYYLGYEIALLSPELSHHSIKIFSIDGKVLNRNVQLIKTKTGISNQLGYEVDQSKKGNSEIPLEQTQIQYDSKQKIISLPLIKADGRVTDKRVKYQFKGKYFEKID